MADMITPARQLLDEAISLTKEPLSKLEQDFARYLDTRLDFRLDRLEVPLWEIKVVNPDGTVKAPDPELGTAAQKFLESARVFRFHGDMDNALKTFYWSRRCSELLSENEDRQREITALRGEAEIWMTFSEVTPDQDTRKNECHKRAADSFLRIAWLQEELGALEAAELAYGNAAHRYFLGHDMEASAYTYVDAARLSEKLEKSEDAAGYYESAAECLQQVENATGTDTDAGLRGVRADWYRKAANQLRTLSDPEARRRAIKDLVQAATLEASTSLPDYTTAASDYWDAVTLAGGLGDQTLANGLKYQQQRIARRVALSEGRYFTAGVSYVSDWIWGYGFKIRRWAYTVVLTILIFAAIYAFRREVRRVFGPIDPTQDWLGYLVMCVEFSVYALLPTGIIKWLTGIGLIVDYHITGWSRILSGIEGLLGLGYLSMGAVILRRKMHLVTTPA